MNWQEACAESADGMAYREHLYHGYYRKVVIDENGCARSWIPELAYSIRAMPEEIDGRNDWTPCREKK